MTGTKHFNFDDEAMNIANRIMLQNGVDFDIDDDKINIYEELEAYNCERKKLGLKPATIEEYCEAAGYDIDEFIDTSFNYADMLEDYVEGEEEGINVDSGEWYTGDESDKDDWDEADYENASKFDE